MSSHVYISVIITAFNRRKFLSSAIESAINQSLSRDKYEIIVSKNFSDDSIDQIIAANGIKGLISKQLNYGKQVIDAAKIARGDILCFLEDDDSFRRDRLQFVYDTFNANPDIALLRNNVEPLCEIDGRKCKPPWKAINSSFLIKAKNLNLEAALKINRQGIDSIISSTAIRKGIFLSAEQQISECHLFDYILPYFVLYNNYNLLVSDTALTVYRIHDSWTHILDGSRDVKLQRKRKELENTINDYQVMLKKFYSNETIRNTLNFHIDKMKMELSLINGERVRHVDYVFFAMLSLKYLNIRRVMLLFLDMLKLFAPTSAKEIYELMLL